MLATATSVYCSGITTEWNPHNPYDSGSWCELGMTPFSMPDPSEPIDIKLPIPCDSPPRKKPRPLLSLRKNTKKEDSRFVSSSKSLGSYQRGFVPKNTDVDTSWAIRKFEDWSGEKPFYVRLLERVPTDEGTPWFTSVVRKNTLSGMTKTMCTEAGISRNKTNHLLCAYPSTEVYSKSRSQQLY